MSDDPKRYIGKEPQEVNIGSPVGGDSEASESQKPPEGQLTEAEKEFFENIPKGFHVVPDATKLQDYLLKLEKLGLVKIVQIGITGSKYYQKIIK